MLCVDCLYIYFPQISLIITGIYFPLISQINTDLNNILSFTPYTLHLTPLSVPICAIRGRLYPLPLHLTPYTTIRVHPCYLWEIIAPFQQKYYPCGTIRTISDKGTIFRAHMQGVGYKNTKFCCFSSKCLHMCKIFCTFVAEMHISAVDCVGML